MNDGPTLTLAEAARRSTCSLSTLRRRLNADDIEGAYKDDTGVWAIPIRSLVTAGLLAPTTAPDALEQPPSNDDDHVLELERKLITAEHRARLAETERDAAKAELRRADQVIETQAAALRMLEPVSASEIAVEADHAASAPDTPSTFTRTIMQRLARPFRAR